MDQKTMENELKNCKVRQGPLYKRSKFLKEWRERWVVLTMNYLFTFTNKSCKEVTDIIDLKQVKSYKSYLRKVQEMIPAGFKLRSEDQQIYFCGRNCIEKWSWIVTLERLMDYKYVGSSTYNNIEFIKSRGFMSQMDFENEGKIEKSSAPQKQAQVPKKSAEQAKKSVENQVAAIMRQLQNQKQQLKQKELEFTQKQKVLKQQQIALKKQQSQTIKQLEKKLSEAAESPKKQESQPAKIVKQSKKQPQPEIKIEKKPSDTASPVIKTKSSVTQSKTQQSLKEKEEKPIPIEEISKVNIGGTGPKVSELKNLYEQKMATSQSTVPTIKLTFDNSKNAKKKSIADELYPLRSRTITNLFEEFHDANPEPEALKFTLDFLVKMASDKKFGYDSCIVVQAKSHKNRKFFADIFVELITDYRDLENCHLLAKFIQVCVFQAPDFFKENHIPIIKSKLTDFFLAIDDENKLEIILKTIFIVKSIQKYQKNEFVKSKLERLTKQAKKEQIKNWARKLADDF